MDKILICSWPLANTFGPSSEDPVLSAAVLEYYDDELAPAGVELFQHQGNKIATERGYFGAFYEKDVEICEE
jgi:hypothetical protein